MELLDIAKRVRRGVALLDKKIPKWRDVLWRHREQFDFSNGQCCVLGTLEHYSARMKQLKAKGASKDERDRFSLACNRLGIAEADEHQSHGFAFITGDYDSDHAKEETSLAALWRAEFEKL